MEPNHYKGINILPEEMLVEIFSYLELEDVLSCCLVCKTWRNALNANVIWLNLCSQFSRKTLELLQAPAIVDPPFTSLTQTSPTLTETCPWRLRFMQGAHLWRNWRSGRCVAYPIPSAVYYKCGDDDVIYVRDYREGFSRYCINSRPRLLQTTRLSLRRVRPCLFKLTGGKLVVLQRTLVQVFSKTPSNDEMFELSQQFLFDKSESESDNIPNSPDITEWYGSNIGMHSSDVLYCIDHNGDYFVGLILEGNLNKAVLHIWDPNTRQKTKEILVPDISYRVVGITFSIHSSSLYILMTVTGSIDTWTVIRCLSLNTFKYTDLNIEVNSVVNVFLKCDKLLLSCRNYGNNVWIWRAESGSLVHKLSCDFDIYKLEFVFNMVILAGDCPSGLTGTVKVFNTSSLKYTCEFKTKYTIDNLFFISSRLILVCGLGKSEIWDIATKTKLQKLKYQECLWVSPAKTKMLVRKDGALILLHFW